ncbi:MAG: hypothetical protein FD159_2735 [Syntrophaceae bacterium]|nr:MAG: hypothetical protein FD159_2735 [Syntrophaceae bacterium]
MMLVGCAAIVFIKNRLYAGGNTGSMSISPIQYFIVVQYYFITQPIILYETG